MLANRYSNSLYMGHIWSNDKRTSPLKICYDLFSPQREGSTLSAIINNFSSRLLHDFPIRPPHGLHPALPRPPSTHPPPSILLGIIMLIQAIRLYFLSLKKKMFMWRPHGVGPIYSIPQLDSHFLLYIYRYIYICAIR